MRRITPRISTILATGVLCGVMGACQQPSRRYSDFTITKPPAPIRDQQWTKLLEDPRGDGQREDSADGRAFYYHYDESGDMLWFKFELYLPIGEDKPALSVAIDVDGDQGNGIPWYGSNAAFRFEKMLSVGPVETAEGGYRGYNGVTNEDGVTNRDWVNEKQGVIVAYAEPDAGVYYLGVSRPDVDPGLRRFNVIGSVGANARWNDDIGDSGYGSIALPGS